MRLRDDLQLRRLSDATEAAQSELLIDGRPTGSRLAGARLEAAIEHPHGLLLLLSDACPEEEVLHLYELDARGRLRDSARIGARYCAGVLSELTLLPPDRLSFRFVEAAPWIVQLHPRPRLACPGWPDTRGVWRGLNWRRRFAVLRAAVPPDRAPTR